MSCPGWEIAHKVVILNLFQDPWMQREWILKKFSMTDVWDGVGGGQTAFEEMASKPGGAY